MGYVALHVHTGGSILDGLGMPDDYAVRAKELGQEGISITDHAKGGFTLVPSMVAACRAQGIKPILGIEGYLAIGSRFSPRELRQDAIGGEGQKTKFYEHITLIAATPTGWRNLVKINNESWRTVKSGYPLMDWDLIEAHNEGIICLTGCVGGPVLSQAVRGRMDRAEAALDRIVSIFGVDRTFVEVMHHGIAEEDAVVPAVMELAASKGLKCVATADCHYVRPEQAQAHEAWLAKQRKKKLSDTDRWTFHGSGYYLMGEDEVRALDDSPAWQEAVSNTTLVADLVADEVLPPKKMRLPIPPVPEQFADEEDPLTAWVIDWAISGPFGLRVRGHMLPGDHIPPERADRLNSELSVFQRLGMVGYALQVAEMIQWAKDQGIVVGPGRGSGAGSLLLYYLGITDVDPLEVGTLFERFLDPEREGMPDVDSDFERGRRDEVWQHLVDMYGEANTCRLGTLGISKTKASIKSAGSQYGIADEKMNRLTKKIPDGVTMSVLTSPSTDEEREAGEQFRIGLAELDQDASSVRKVASLTGGALVAQVRAWLESASRAAAAATTDEDKSLAFEQAEKAARTVLGDRASGDVDHDYQEAVRLLGTMKPNDVVGGSSPSEAVMALASDFEGVPANQSTHACGVIVSPDDLTDLVPMRLDVKKDKDTGEVHEDWVTQWDGPTCEAMGLVKLDLLGLRNLDVVAHTCQYVGLDVADIPRGRDVPGDVAWDMLGRGDTGSIFQLESSGMRELCTQMAPRNEADLSALGALYRPGPMGMGMHTSYANRRNGREAVSYDAYTSDPAEQEVLRGIMEETYGLAPYQETLMRMGAVVGGFTASGTNLLRKAISKKNAEKIRKVGEDFVAGAVLDHNAAGEPKLAFSRETAQRLWDNVIKPAGRYAFNKCVPGDTIVVTGDDRSMTIAELFRLEAGERPATLVAYNRASGALEPQALADVHDNGVRPVWAVNLDGRPTIRSTGNHRWLTTEGYKRTDELTVLDALVTADGAATVTRVAPTGVVTRVYDLEMGPGTDHNFLADGVVSHNSHSVAYARTTWSTAWLKAHYPAAFGAATLAETKDEARRGSVLQWLDDRGITVLPPDVNHSDVSTSVPDDRSILLGLGEIKDVGKPARDIVAARPEGGYVSVRDVLDRYQARTGSKLTSKVLEAMAKAGALDAFGPRAGLVASVRAYSAGGEPTVPAVEYTPYVRSLVQTSVLGTATGGSIMDEPEVAAAVWGTTDEYGNRTVGAQSANGRLPVRLKEAADSLAGRFVVTAGSIASIELKSSESWRRASIVLADGVDRLEVTCWGEQHDAVSSMIPGQVLLVAGKMKVDTFQVSSHEDAGADDVDDLQEVTRVSLGVREVVPISVPVPGMGGVVWANPQDPARHAEDLLAEKILA